MATETVQPASSLASVVKNKTKQNKTKKNHGPRLRSLRGDPNPATLVLYDLWKIAVFL